MIRLSAVLIALCGTLVWTRPALASFSPQVRVGFTQGDQWEPSIAADGYGHVYILISAVQRGPRLPVLSQSHHDSGREQRSWRFLVGAARH